MINSYSWLAIISFIIFISISLMVWTNFKPFIRLEEKTATLFEKSFGHPKMGYSDGFFNGFLTFLVTYGSAPYLSILTVIIAIFLFLKGYLSLAIGFLAMMSSGGILGILLKNVFKRPRPKNSLSFESGYSFPSGHAIASSIFFLSIIFLLFPMISGDFLRMILTGILLLLWSLLIFSRLYFHAHHLGDLIVGVFYAIFWVKTGIYIYSFILSRFIY
ncbi:MAG: phosphatase PAP2 family protein [Atopostipes sp.]|nr:phosphatase PAP2 family protein [Atopostipes sp.]